MIFFNVRAWINPERVGGGWRLENVPSLLNSHAVKRIIGDEVEDYNGMKYKLVPVAPEKDLPFGDAAIEECLVKIGE